MVYNDKEYIYITYTYFHGDTLLKIVLNSLYKKFL